MLSVDATAVVFCDARGLAVVERWVHESLGTRSGLRIGLPV